MLKQDEDGTIVDMMPKIETTERNLLQWRKPTDHPCDMDDAIEVTDRACKLNYEALIKYEWMTKD